MGLLDKIGLKKKNPANIKAPVVGGRDLPAPISPDLTPGAAPVGAPTVTVPPARVAARPPWETDPDIIFDEVAAAPAAPAARPPWETDVDIVFDDVPLLHPQDVSLEMPIADPVSANVVPPVVQSPLIPEGSDFDVVFEKHPRGLEINQSPNVEGAARIPKDTPIGHASDGWVLVTSEEGGLHMRPVHPLEDPTLSERDRQAIEAGAMKLGKGPTLIDAEARDRARKAQKTREDLERARGEYRRVAGTANPLEIEKWKTRVQELEEALPEFTAGMDEATMNSIRLVESLTQMYATGKALGPLPTQAKNPVLNKLLANPTTHAMLQSGRNLGIVGAGRGIPQGPEGVLKEGLSGFRTGAFLGALGGNPIVAMGGLTSLNAYARIADGEGWESALEKGAIEAATTSILFGALHGGERAKAVVTRARFSAAKRSFMRMGVPEDASAGIARALYSEKPISKGLAKRVAATVRTLDKAGIDPSILNGVNLRTPGELNGVLQPVIRAKVADELYKITGDVRVGDALSNLMFPAGNNVRAISVLKDLSRTFGKINVYGEIISDAMGPAARPASGGPQPSAGRPAAPSGAKQIGRYTGGTPVVKPEAPAPVSAVPVTKTMGKSAPTVIVKATDADGVMIASIEADGASELEAIRELRSSHPGALVQVAPVAVAPTAPEVGDQRSEIRGEGEEVRGQGSGVRGQGEEAGGLPDVEGKKAVESFGEASDRATGIAAVKKTSEKLEPPKGGTTNLETPLQAAVEERIEGADEDLSDIRSAEEAQPAASELGAGIEPEPVAARARYEDGREVTFNRTRYVARDGKFYNIKGGKPITRPELIEQINERGNKIITPEETEANREIIAERKRGQQVTQDVLSADPIADAVIAGGIRRPKDPGKGFRSGKFLGYPEEFKAIPRRFWAGAKDRSAKTLDEWATDHNITDEELRAHLIGVEERIERAIISGLAEEAGIDELAEREIWEAMESVALAGNLPSADLRSEFKELWGEVLTANGIRESSLTEAPAEVDSDDMELLAGGEVAPGAPEVRDQGSKVRGTEVGETEVKGQRSEVIEPLTAETLNSKLETQEAFASEEWIGVDLDGTLAVYKDWKGPEHIGAPIPAMVDRVKGWLADGKQVKILTARAAPGPDQAAGIAAIEAWTAEQFGQSLQVVAEKDQNMTESWDDRAVQVVPNTGERVDGKDSEVRDQGSKVKGQKAGGTPAVQEKKVGGPEFESGDILIVSETVPVLSYITPGRYRAEVNGKSVRMVNEKTGSSSVEKLGTLRRYGRYTVETVPEVGDQKTEVKGQKAVLDISPSWETLSSMNRNRLRKVAKAIEVAGGGSNLELRERIGIKLGFENEVIAARLVKAAKQTDTNPSEGQKEAENYKVGRLRYRGTVISIENPVGSVRSGVSEDGKAWSQTMQNTYGRLLGVKNADGDNTDIFFNDVHPVSDTVYIVNQVDAKGAFDEEKVMLGFESEKAARAAYLSNYEAGWDGLGSIDSMSWESYKELLSHVDNYPRHLAAKTGTTALERDDESSTARNLEAGRRARAGGDAARKGVAKPDVPGAGRGDGEAGGLDGGQKVSKQGDLGLPDGADVVPGERGDQPGGIEGGRTGAEAGAARGVDELGGGDVGGERVLTDAGAITSIKANTPESESDRVDQAGDGKLGAVSPVALKSRVTAQKRAEKIDAKLIDEQNIRATLPVLFPEQHDDVIHAENRLLAQKRHGMLFTNGTGTGKTFTGLGIAKRFLKLGKKNILIVTPTDAKNGDWQEDAKLLHINAHILDGIKDAGRGVTITTYANFYQNAALAQRDFDLVIYDESHKLTQGKQDPYTEYSSQHKAITRHPEFLWKLARLRSPAMQQVIAKYAGEEINREDPLYIQGLAEVREQEELLKGADRAKVVFLSASPFAYHKSVDYVEGYLFDYVKREGGEGYNVATGLDEFLVSNFGYQMRNNRPNRPDAEVDVDLMERQMHENLKKDGAVIGRTLKLDVDYSREFVDVARTSKQAHRLNEAFGLLNDQNQDFDLLRAEARRLYTYHYTNYMLESMKAVDAVRRTSEHLALGRQVVVFHSYNNVPKAFASNPAPFRFKKISEAEIGEMYYREREAALKYNAQVDAFTAALPGIDTVRWKFPNPLAVFQKEFGDDAVFINGTVPKGKRRKNVKAFNAARGPKIAVVQIDAGKEGISLHDKAGDVPRALINIGLPTKPTDLIQSEGRIYRMGSESNAVYEYLKLGLDFEQRAFNDKVSSRSRTAENLALGNLARDLEQVLKDGYQNSVADAPHAEQGTGGKEIDERTEAGELSGFDYAKTFYYAKQKRTRRDKSREGADYFATPEPVGQKMVEWAGVRPGGRVLEPSAGDGAIGRWFPSHTENTLIEPSYELMTKLQSNVSGSHNRFEDGTFEDLYIGNKYNAVVMNPPFGSGGRTAVDHLAKAFGHLKDGGRVVALIPEGPSADKKFDKWYESEELKDAYMVGNIHLPNVTFERAGTAVKTRIVIIDKQGNPVDAQQPREMSFEHVEKIGDLFDAIEEVGFERPGVPTPVESEVRGQRSEIRFSVAPAGSRKVDSGLGHLADDELLSVGRPEDDFALEMVVKEAILRQPNGIYLLSTTGRAAPSLQAAVSEALGYDVGRDFLEKAVRGLSVQYPNSVNASLTLGLEEVRLSNYTVEDKPRFSVAAPVDTPEFKKWFGDSKVVDAAGNPLVVYHGTAAGGFNEFDSKRPGKNQLSYLGFWFASDKAVAESFVKERSSFFGHTKVEDGVNEQVKALFLSIQNPYVYEKVDNADKIEAVKQRIRELSDDKKALNKEYRALEFKYNSAATERRAEILVSKREIEAKLSNRIGLGLELKILENNDPLEQLMDDRDIYAEWYNGLKGIKGAWRDKIAERSDHKAPSLALREQLIAEGYDGIILKGTIYDSPDDVAGDQYVAFNPTQIKSATGNVGTFDAGDPDIRFSAAAGDGAPILKLIDDYEFGEEGIDSLSDLIDRLEQMENDAVDSAIREYRSEVQEDQEEWGMRGDDEQYEEAFLDRLRDIAKDEASRFELTGDESSDKELSYGTENGDDVGRDPGGLRRDGGAGLGEGAAGGPVQRGGRAAVVVRDPVAENKNLIKMGAEARRRVGAEQSRIDALGDRAGRDVPRALLEDLQTFEPDMDRIEADGRLFRTPTGQMIVPVKTRRMNGFLSTDGKTIFVSTSTLDPDMNYDQTKDHETVHAIEEDTGPMGQAVNGLIDQVDSKTPEYKSYHAKLSGLAGRNYADAHTASEITADFVAEVPTHYGVNIAGAYGESLPAAEQTRDKIRLALRAVSSGVGVRGIEGEREDRDKRTEDRGQRSEDRGQRTEIKGQRLEEQDTKLSVAPKRIAPSAKPDQKALREQLDSGELSYNEFAKRMFTEEKFPRKTVFSKDEGSNYSKARLMIGVKTMRSGNRRVVVSKTSVDGKTNRGVIAYYNIHTGTVNLGSEVEMYPELDFEEEMKLFAEDPEGYDSLYDEEPRQQETVEKMIDSLDTKLSVAPEADAAAKLKAVEVLTTAFEERKGKFTKPSKALLKRRMKKLVAAIATTSEIRDQRTEDRDQRTEDRDQRSGERGQRTEIRDQRSKDKAVALAEFAGRTLPDGMRWRLKGTLQRLAKDPSVDEAEFYRAAMNKTLSLLEEAKLLSSDPKATIVKGNITSPQLGAMTEALKDLASKQSEDPRPVTDEIRAEFAGEEIVDPVLKEYVESLEAGIQKTREKQTVKLVEKGKKAKMAGLRDVERAFESLQEKTGIPFWNMYRRIFFIDRDVDFDSREDVDGIFEGLKNDDGKPAKVEDIIYNPESEDRIILYLDTGIVPPSMTDFELDVGDRIKRIYQEWEPMVKAAAHLQWERTGELPGKGTPKQMKEGTAIRTEYGADSTEYSDWIDSQDFGVRTFYSPKQHEFMQQVMQDEKRHFGRGFTKKRLGPAEKKSLIGGLYSYIRNARRVRDLEPHLKQMEELFNENSKTVDSGIVDRFFNNLYGHRMKLDVGQKILLKGTGQFFRVRIPQAFARWVIRNKFQPSMNVIPRVFSPTDPLFWKNLRHIWSPTSGAKVGTIQHYIAKKLKADDEFATYFHRYVSSLDSARTEKLMQDMNKYDALAKVGDGFWRAYDSIGKMFTWSDVDNRAQSFVYGYEVATDALARYREKPTAANWNKFLNVTGMQLAPKLEQVELANLVAQGRDGEAAYLVAHRLSDATQFRYARPEKGLAFQEPGKGLHLIAPIATYSKGTAQMLADDLSAINDFMKTPSKQSARRAMKGLSNLMFWYLLSLLGNRIYEEIFGVDRGAYGIGTLKYIPGGPVMEHLIDLIDALYSTWGEDKGWDYKAAKTIHEAADFYVPFYHLLNRLVTPTHETGEGTRLTQAYFKIPMEARRLIKEKVAEMTGKATPRDTRRWVELKAGEQMQRIILDGAHSTQKQKLQDLYTKWMESKDLSKGKKKDQLLEAFRKYPLSSKKSFRAGKAKARDVRSLRKDVRDVSEPFIEGRRAEYLKRKAAGR